MHLNLIAGIFLINDCQLEGKSMGGTLKAPFGKGVSLGMGENRDSEEKGLLKTASLGGGRHPDEGLRRPCLPAPKPGQTHYEAV